MLQELAIIAAIAVAVTIVLGRLRVPTTAGFLFAGTLVGPHALGVVGSIEHIQALAEVGVVLLLFTIGLELSLARLRAIAKVVAVGGSLQVGLAIGTALLSFLAVGRPVSHGLVYGFILALSSTAIVLRALSDRGETDAPHGRFVVGVLVFQDLCVVPMVLVVPLLAGGSGDLGVQLGLALVKATVVVVAVLVGGRWLLARALPLVDVTRSREVFVLAIVGICVGTAFVTSLAGLSLALGAFLAGVLVADTDFRHRAMSEVLPLRDVFTSVFFVSLGMLFDPRVVLRRPLEVLALLVAFTVVKGALASLACIAMRFPARVAWLSGVALGQFGEFGFVLVTLATGAGILAADEASAIIAAGVISMAATPILLRVAPHIGTGARLLAPLERLLGGERVVDAQPEHRALEGHAVIVGLGVGGRLVAEALERRDVPFLALELNAETVRRERAKQRPVYYGDASSREVLDHAGLKAARVLVLMMNDRDALQRTIAAARDVAPEVPIVARAKYLAEREQLFQLGADVVVAEEVEAAVEIVGRVMRAFDLARNEIDDAVHAVRVATYGSPRRATVPRKHLRELEELADLKIESVAIDEHAHAVGRTARDLDLRNTTGALMVALRRESALVEASGDTPLLAGDRVYLVGAPDAVRDAVRFLRFGQRASLA